MKGYERIGHKLLDSWMRDNFLRFDRYTEESSRRKRAGVLSKMVYTIVVYTITSIAGYLIIKDTSMMPTWLGGSGQCANAYLHAPSITEDTFAMRLYILVTFGKYLNSLVTHSFIRPEGNYYEYVLHHGMTAFLILFSYLTNYWLIGVFIIFIHNLSDLVLNIARFYMVPSKIMQDYRYNRKVPGIVLNALAFSIWVGCRMVVHVACCCWPIPEAYKHILVYYNDVRR